MAGEEIGLDEVAFKVRLLPILSSLCSANIFHEKLASITPLPAKANEPLVKVGTTWINPVADDLKVLKYKKGGWSVSISCDSVLADGEKQKF